jgi:hypothetical protein
MIEDMRSASSRREHRKVTSAPSMLGDIISESAGDIVGMIEGSARSRVKAQSDRAIEERGIAQKPD